MVKQKPRPNQVQRHLKSALNEMEEHPETPSREDFTGHIDKYCPVTRVWGCPENCQICAWGLLFHDQYVCCMVALPAIVINVHSDIKKIIDQLRKVGNKLRLLEKSPGISV